MGIDLAVWALFVGVLGIGATLFAPRMFLKTARVDARLRSVQRLTRKASSNNVTVDVKHNGVLVADDTFIVSALIANIGNVDLIEAHLVAPVEFDVSAPFELLSVETKPSVAKINATSETANNSARIRWINLRPRERIDLELLVTAPKNSSADDVAAGLSVSARLVDVKLGSSMWLRQRWLRVFCISWAAVMAYFVVALAILSSLPQSVLAVTTPAGERYISTGVNSIELCSMSELPLALLRCEAAKAEDVIGLLPSAKIQKTARGLPEYFFGVAIAVSLFAGAAFSTLSSRRLARFVGRRLRKTDEPRLTWTA
jgi:hypothetical protein